MKGIAEEYAYNGKHYYVPYTLSSNFAINYNRLVLEEYGLPDPMALYQSGEWTWDTFRDMLRKWCDISPEHIGYTGVGAMSFIATTGTKIVDVQNTEIINNLNSEKIVHCMEYLEDLCRQGLTGDGYYSEEQYDLLQDMITPENGKFVMLFDNVNGFNSDLSSMFQGGDESLFDGDELICSGDVCDGGTFEHTIGDVKLWSAESPYLINSLLRFINAGEYLDCKWEITHDGGTAETGSFTFSVQPMGNVEIDLPVTAKAFEQDAYIRFIFTAKNDYSVFNDVEEVCFDQLKIFTVEKEAAPVSETAPAYTALRQAIPNMCSTVAPRNSTVSP